MKKLRHRKVRQLAQICIFAHTHTRVCIYIRVYVCVFGVMHTCKRVIYTHTRTIVYKHTYISMYMTFKIKVKHSQPLCQTPVIWAHSRARPCPVWPRTALLVLSDGSWRFMPWLYRYVFTQPPPDGHVTSPDFSPTPNNPAKWTHFYT